MALSLAQELWVAEGTSTLASVIHLDSVWTRYAESATSVDPTDRAALVRLGGALRSALVQSEAYSRQFREFLSDNRAEVDDNPSFEPFRERITDAERAKLDQWTGTFGSLSALGAWGSEGIASTAAEEAEIIRRKVDDLLSGGITDGDVSHSFLCNVAAGLIVGGCLSANPMAFGFGVGLALGADC